MISLVFRNALGMSMTVTSESDSPLEIARHWGKKGWTCIDIPEDGIALPFVMHDKFDWAVIGARAFTYQKEGNTIEAVEHLGRVYTKRHMPENKVRKLPELYRYSRGADADERAAGNDSTFQYVALADFREKGPIKLELCVPREQAAPRERDIPPAVEPAARQTGALPENYTSPDDAPVTAVQLKEIEKALALVDASRRAKLAVEVFKTFKRSEGAPPLRNRGDLTSREAVLFIARFRDTVAAQAQSGKAS